MARPNRALALALMALVLGPPLAGAGPAAAGPLADAHDVPVPVAALDLRVAVVLAGFALTAPEQDALRSSVGDTWAPFVAPTQLPVGIEYTVDLRFAQGSGAFDAALADTINSSLADDDLGRFVGNYPGLIDNLSAAFPSIQQSTPLPHADADQVLSFLAGAGDTYPEVAGGTDEVRLFFLNPTGVEVPYYYRIDSRDTDRGLNLTFETANAWGGVDGIFFQDLRAAPNHIGEGTVDGRPANFAGQPPLWSYGDTASERARLVGDLAYYINTSIRILAAPSYAVTPFYPDTYALNVTLFDATASQDLFQPGGVGAPFGVNSTQDVLDPDQVRAAVSDLFPLSPVTVDVRVSDRTVDPAIGTAVTANTDLGPSGVLLLDPFGLNTDLKETFGVPNQPILPGDSVSLPALVVILDDESYVQSVGTRGATLQRSDGRAASIIIAVGVEQAAQRGLTDTVIHEAGHSLGLGHPHEMPVPGGTGGATVYVDWLRDLTSTPMTYLPSYVDYSFDSFDKRAVASGVAATTLAAAYLARKEAWSALDSRGYSNTTVAASFQEEEALFQTFAAQSAASMAAGDFFTPAGVTSAASGAAVSAKRAYDQAKDMLVQAVLTARCCDTGQDRPFLPGPGAGMAVGALAAVALTAFVGAGRGRRRRQ